MHEHSDSPEYQFNGNKDAIFDVTGHNRVVYNPETGLLRTRSSGRPTFLPPSKAKIYEEGIYSGYDNNISLINTTMISCALAIIYLKKIPCSYVMNLTQNIRLDLAHLAVGSTPENTETEFSGVF